MFSVEIKVSHVQFLLVHIWNCIRSEKPHVKRVTLVLQCRASEAETLLCFSQKHPVVRIICALMSQRLLNLLFNEEQGHFYYWEFLFSSSFFFLLSFSQHVVFWLLRFCHVSSLKWFGSPIWWESCRVLSCGLVLPFHKSTQSHWLRFSVQLSS